MKQISGWGNYPKINAEEFLPSSVEQLCEIVSRPSFVGIPRGMGRSYGDSSLAAETISTLSLNHFISFAQSTGILKCYSGVTLADILDVFPKQGWFLSVTPGTKYVSVGGAIASDVHGKNHHLAGTFCEHVISFQLVIAGGEIVNCSRDENAELFRATCGGMGLTGVILTATLKLLPVQSTYIQETTIKTKDLKQTLELFDQHEKSPYSVAWIDCLSTGRKLGRSKIILGEHSKDQCFDQQKKSATVIPFNFPDFALNPISTKLFNQLYYNLEVSKKSQNKSHYESYFYPLDKIQHWNKIYGRQGFIQYQFVIPKEAGYKGLNSILQKIAASNRGSFLSVLKVLGKPNDNYLSFPIEGYTLALDFKFYNGLFKFLNQLDEIVIDYGGRVYLTKDARLNEKIFKQSYPNWQQFNEVRHNTGADKVFQSAQSIRLGL